MLKCLYHYILWLFLGLFQGCLFCGGSCLQYPRCYFPRTWVDKFCLFCVQTLNLLFFLRLLQSKKEESKRTREKKTFDRTSTAKALCQQSTPKFYMTMTMGQKILGTKKHDWKLRKNRPIYLRSCLGFFFLTTSPRLLRLAFEREDLFGRSSFSLGEQ